MIIAQIDEIVLDEVIAHVGVGSADANVAVLMLTSGLKPCLPSLGKEKVSHFFQLSLHCC